MKPALVLRQSLLYARTGLGVAGALLKHSLVPLSLLAKVLPERGLVLDLGCGEGMLANLVARNCPGLQVHGVDRDVHKIALANARAPGNARFEAVDVLKCSFEAAAAAIFNDVLHHHETSTQVELLRRAAEFVDTDGMLIVKEVDALDRKDRAWTAFWDRRLYPEDTLVFRTLDEWRRVLFECGFRVLSVHRVRHVWPASRTVLVCQRRRRSRGASGPRASGRVRVLVTGGTGFIGRHLVRRLCEQGLDGRATDVTVLARDETRIPADLDQGCNIVSGDLESLPARAAALREMEYVFHLAADKDYFGGPRVFERNLRGTVSLLEALQGSAKLKRLVFASSMGAVDRHAADDCSTPVVEASPAYPVSHYGRAKYECEERIKASLLPFTILRLPWCYGPGMTRRTHVRALTESVRRGKLATRFDWPGRVSLLDVEEAARAFVWVATNPATDGRTLFVTDGSPIRLGDLLRQTARIVGRSEGLIRIPAVVSGLIRRGRRIVPFTARSLFLDTLWVDDRRIRELGFTARPREEGFLVPLVRFMNTENRPSICRSRALITGAASGIGRALAAQLAATGRRLVLVDVDPSVVVVANDLPGAEARVADLADRAGLDEIERLVGRPDVNLVVNCAGIGMRGAVAAAEPKELTAMLDVNVHALTQLSRAAAKNFQEAGEGVLVNISSSAALQPLPGMAAYAGSKAYVLSFSEALAAEQARSSIAVVAVCPRGVATRFQERAGVRILPGERLLRAEEVAAAIVRAVQRRQSRVLFVGARTHLAAMLARFLPRRLNLRLWKRLVAGLR